MQKLFLQLCHVYAHDTWHSLLAAASVCWPTMLNPHSLLQVRARYPALAELNLASNGLQDVHHLALLPTLTAVDLSHNLLTLDAVATLAAVPALRHLTLAGNPVAAAATYRRDVHRVLPALHTLDGVPLAPPVPPTAVTAASPAAAPVASASAWRPPPASPAPSTAASSHASWPLQPAVVLPPTPGPAPQPGVRPAFGAPPSAAVGPPTPQRHPHRRPQPPPTPPAARAEADSDASGRLPTAERVLLVSQLQALHSVVRTQESAMAAAKADAMAATAPPPASTPSAASYDLTLRAWRAKAFELMVASHLKEAAVARQRTRLTAAAATAQQLLADMDATWAHMDTALTRLGARLSTAQRRAWTLNAAFARATASLDSVVVTAAAGPPAGGVYPPVVVPPPPHSAMPVLPSPAASAPPAARPPSSSSSPSPSLSSPSPSPSPSRRSSHRRGRHRRHDRTSHPRRNARRAHCHRAHDHGAPWYAAAGSGMGGNASGGGGGGGGVRDASDAALEGLASLTLGLLSSDRTPALAARPPVTSGK